MTDIKWHSIEDLYTIEKYKIKHKKHGGAEKVRKALVNLLNVFEHNTSVTKTKYWERIRLQHKPNSSNIRIGIIKTNAIKKTYLQESL